MTNTSGSREPAPESHVGKTPFDPGVGSGPLSVRALVRGLVDYAGLFPPAKLAMAPAVANFASYLASPRAWMLGRFICPVSRLGDFAQASAQFRPRVASPASAEGDPTGERASGWRLSALTDGELERDIEHILAFNQQHSEPSEGLAVVDGIELKVPASGGTAFIDHALELIPDELFPFFEFPAGAAGSDARGQAAPDPRGLAAALAGADAGAKIRTGGVTPDAFPAAGVIADFLLACRGAGIPFKATAGLHHPVRGPFNLTYEPGCARATMYGYLNVFVAAAAVHARVAGRDQATALLEESDHRAFAFVDEGVRWRDLRVPTSALHDARQDFALSFGSCSFDEPTGELAALGLI